MSYPAPHAPAFIAPPEPGPGEPFDGAADPDDLDRPLYGATFGQAIVRFFRACTRFEGRASRSEYWWARLFVSLLFLMFASLGFAASTIEDLESDAPAPLFTAFAIVTVAALLAILLPMITLTWRRLHDANLPGPLWFLVLVPYGDFALLIMTLLGPKPLGRRFDVPR